MKIPISILGTLDYCEYKIYFKEWLKKQKKKIKVPIPKKMIEGAKKHAELNKEYVPVDTDEIMKKRELSVTGKKIRGRVDEIIKENNTILIIDDKPHDTAYNGDIWQVMAYCKAYKEQHQDELDDDIELYGAIRNWNTEKIVWKEKYTEEYEKLIEDKVDRVIGIIEETITPISTDNPFKCSKCNLKKTCDKSLYQEFDARKFIGEKTK